MQVKLFGIARDIAKTNSLHVGQDIKTVADLKKALVGIHPELALLKSIAVAVDHEYAGDEHPLNPDSEVAVIPPVSGG
ncbi:MAG: molybdopterin converting factor subunit 1 [Mucilaginibacter polytrichastri]|nr:molybdopterin converting factor subunit 1 [Mucilaginibacter polytrichastri]